VLTLFIILVKEYTIICFGVSVSVCVATLFQVVEIESIWGGVRVSCDCRCTASAQGALPHIQI